MRTLSLAALACLSLSVAACSGGGADVANHDDPATKDPGKAGDGHDQGHETPADPAKSQPDAGKSDPTPTTPAKDGGGSPEAAPPPSGVRPRDVTLGKAGADDTEVTLDKVVVTMQPVTLSITDANGSSCALRYYVQGPECTAAPCGVEIRELIPNVTTCPAAGATVAASAYGLVPGDVVTVAGKVGFRRLDQTGLVRGGKGTPIAPFVVSDRAILGNVGQLAQTYEATLITAHPATKLEVTSSTGLGFRMDGVGLRATTLALGQGPFVKSGDELTSVTGVVAATIYLRDAADIVR